MRLISEIAFEILKVKDFNWLQNFKSKPNVRRFVKFVKAWEPDSVDSFVKIAEFFENEENSLNLVSAFCFHATKERDNVVSELSPTIIDLICETVEVSLEPERIKEWVFYTFGPGDSKLIKETNLEDILLPFMRNLSAAQMESFFSKQWELTRMLIKRLNEMKIPVILKTLTELASQVNTSEIFKEAEARGKEMFKKFESGEVPAPKIFEFLSPEERQKRCEKEAIIYLMLTEVHGRDKGIYLGLEVHGGYWKVGGLNKYKKNFLPLCWPHPVVRQHWGKWAEKEKDHLIRKYRGILKKMKTL